MDTGHAGLHRDLPRFRPQIQGFQGRFEKRRRLPWKKTDFRGEQIRAHGRGAGIRLRVYEAGPRGLQALPSRIRPRHAGGGHKVQGQADGEDEGRDGGGGQKNRAQKGGGFRKGRQARRILRQVYNGRHRHGKGYVSGRDRGEY